MKQPTGYDSDLRSTSQAGKLPGGLLFCYMKIITILFEHYPLGICMDFILSPRYPHDLRLKKSISGE